MSSRGFESDSGELASSTADEIEESSRRSTTDDFGEYSDRGSTTDTDSNEENSACKSLTPKECKKYANARLDSAKINVQSDTETKNLLDDIGEDLDEDIMNLQEADNVSSVSEPVQLDSKLFELSDEQITYYTNCFLYLMKRSQGFASLQGVIQGTDRIVLDFFRKSRLDELTLSKIWALSDLNEDGFLNLTEFNIAMHLIILHTRGNFPIPTQLPFDSPFTPTHTLMRVENGILGTVPSDSYDLYNNLTSKITGECISSDSGNSQILSSEEKKREEQIGQSEQSQPTSGKHHSLSDDHLNSTTHRGNVIAKFSDVPPLLVDGHPTALDASTSSHILPGFARLFVPTTKGPPPQPPCRDYATGSKGHGRSVSLDLKNFNTLSPGFGFKSSQRSNINLPPKDDRCLSTDKEANEKSIQATCSTRSTGTQCNIECSDESFAMYIKEFDTKLGAKERCKMLQKINEKLETERSTLMQVRLQVQLRINEIESHFDENIQKSLKQGNKPTTL